MPKIRILPEILSNKIAAGEVIERPASVVKELLENALDADSTRILIDLKNAGKSLIRVTDNGLGMNRDDALLAMERYATSKLHKDEDLFEIKTLGFRGEALPSIASVSRFLIESRDRQSEAGTRIQIVGGKIKNVSQVGAPMGTQISVQDLFFNTPARRKFLKTTGTEMGHIADTISRMALAWPGVLFRLTHNGKTVKNWPATQPAERVADVLGGNLKGALYPIEAAHSNIGVLGWVTSARMARKTSRGIYIYVNHRFIRNRMIQHAVITGYGNRLMKGNYPVTVLFLTVPYDQVDVNVHPTKHEVRFANTQVVHQLIQTAVKKAIETADTLKWPPPSTLQRPVAETRPNYMAAPITAFPPPISDAPSPDTIISTKTRTAFSPKEKLPDNHTQAGLWQKKLFADLRIIGQFHDTYILCETNNKELILIDQHAAHERIQYEQLSAKALNHTAPPQRLLIPETIELGFEEARVLASLVETLDRFGLEIAPFGGNTYIVKSVPAMLAGKEIAPLVLQIVEKTMEIGVETGLEEPLDHARKLMACHSAIRANQKLTETQIKTLLEKLDACSDPSHCPHGRPTWIRWALVEIETSFKRRG